MSENQEVYPACVFAVEHSFSNETEKRLFCQDFIASLQRRGVIHHVPEHPEHIEGILEQCYIDVGVEPHAWEK